MQQQQKPKPRPSSSISSSSTRTQRGRAGSVDAQAASGPSSVFSQALSSVLSRASSLTGTSPSVLSKPTVSSEPSRQLSGHSEEASRPSGPTVQPSGPSGQPPGPSGSTVRPSGPSGPSRSPPAPWYQDDYELQMEREPITTAEEPTPDPPPPQVIPQPQQPRAPSTSSLGIFHRQGSTTSTASARSAASGHSGRYYHHYQQRRIIQQQQQQPRQKLLSKEEAEEARRDREARSVAIERAYVHDVYEQISLHISDSRYRAWPRVKQFLQELEPGSVVCDVGCGSGKYLNVNPLVFNIGSDRCLALAKIARNKDHEVLHCDNLNLPFRDDSLDAVLSVAVVHHIATVERRVRAIREMARTLRVGGRVIISVWAMEQKHRKFESQDVLIPWHRPANVSASSCVCPQSSSSSKPPMPPQSSSSSSIARQGLMSSSAGSSFTGGGARRRGGGASSSCAMGAGTTTTTTTTSDDDVTHYHAYTQTSDSAASKDEGHATSGLVRAHRPHRGRQHHHHHRGVGRSVDPLALELGFPRGQSSSELSSPNETCYSFVRRAIRKLSTTTASRRQIGGCGMDIGDFFVDEEFPQVLEHLQQQQQQQQQQLDEQDPEGSSRRRSRGDSHSSSGSSNISRLAWYTLSSLGQFSSSFVMGTEEELRRSQEEHQRAVIAKKRSRPMPESMELSMEREEEENKDPEAKKEEEEEEEAALELAQIMTAEEAEALLGRFDSGESTGDSSLGDMPIELRHLESDFVEDEMAVEEEKPKPASSASSIASNLMHSFFGSSLPQQQSVTSLDEVEEIKDTVVTPASLHSVVRRRPPRLGQVGRASTYDEGAAARKERQLQRKHPSLTATLSAEREEGRSQSAGKMLSGSLRSIGTSTDFPQQPQHHQLTSLRPAGSTTSISSVRSTTSAQSEGGVTAKQKSRTVQEQQQQQHHKPRSWDSEPRLDSATPPTGGRIVPRMLGARSRAVSHHHLLPSSTSVSTSSSSQPCGEKEKSKAMLSVESKLMKAIKEVNESDLSENSTPLTSPAPPKMAQAAATAAAEASSSKRPLLVKQKQSFHFPDEDEEEGGGRDNDESKGEEKVNSPGHEKRERLPVEKKEEEGEEEKEKEVVASSPTPQKTEEEEKTTASSTTTSKGVPPPTAKRAKSLALLPPPPSSWLHKQSSLNEELLSLERVSANVEVRRGSLRKQQSLPTSGAKEGGKTVAQSLKERLQQLRSGWQRLSASSKEEEEEEEEEKSGVGPKDTSSETCKTGSEAETAATASSKTTPAASATSSSAPSSSTLKGPQLPPNVGGSGMGFGGMGFGASEQGIFAGGFVRILQRTWGGRSSSLNSSSDDHSSPAQHHQPTATAATSFTLKKGVTIQPLDVRHPGGVLDSATRRSLFQRRRVSSPISPKQMGALAKEAGKGKAEGAMSPGALRRCCMDYPGDGTGDPTSMIQRERKLSKGEAAGSDSSSKDGSIQSDTSLDSEDSCVSVIFIPHPEGRFGDGSGEAIAAGMTGSTAAAEILVKKQRSTSNSSESSDSMTSGRASPMSPNSHRMGSPIKMAGMAAVAGSSNGTSKAVRQSGQLVEAGANGKFAVARAIREETGEGTTTFFVERPLEKIEERGTESEAEEEEDDGDDQGAKIPIIKTEKEADSKKKDNGDESSGKSEAAQVVVPGPKSFEMEDLPDENPIRCHPAFRAKKPTSRPFHKSSSHSSRRSRFDYPIVRHHPLFAKQRPVSFDAGSGVASSNFSSLLLGENVRVIRRSSAVSSTSMPEQEAPPSAAASKNSRMRSFEIFNPETDDMDSDNESTTTLSSGDDDRSSNGSVESVVSVVKEEDVGSLAPPTLVITEVEDVLPVSDEESYIPVGAMQIVEEKEKAAAKLKEEEEKSKMEKSDKEEIVTDDDSGMASAELRRRAEVRAKLLSFFLEENKSLLGNIVSGGSSRRSRAPVGTASSVESGAETDVDKSKSEVDVQSRSSRTVHAKVKSDKDTEVQKQEQQPEQQQHKTASLPSSSTSKTGITKPAMPKKSPDGHESPVASRASPSPPIYTGTQHPLSLPPGALVVPTTTRSPRRRLDKARSVSPGRHAPAAGTPPVVRQSSVPSRFDEVYIKPTTEMEIRTRRTLMSTGEGGATTTTASGDARKITLAHLDVTAGGDLSGATTTTQSSRESLASISTDGGTGSLSKSKSPSPSRSDASHISSSNTSSSGGRKGASTGTGAIPKKPLSRQASLQREEASGRIRRVSGSSASTPPRRRRQLPPLPTEAQSSSSTSDLRRRPSLEDLAQTESLIPSHGGTDDGADYGEVGGEQQFSVSKLRELDPRFDRAATSSAASGGIASAAASDTESMCSFPYRYAENRDNNKSPISDANKPKPILRRLERKKASGGGREDSLESTSTSAKSSVQYSDTSSLLSHRFSTVSISSNVSSDVSFGGASAGGSSCYLASMSSADFDDGPPSTVGSNRAAVLASSFSLSEADENEYLSQQQQQQEQQQRQQPQMPPQVARTPQERLRMKTLFRRGRETSSSSAKDLRQQQQQQQQQQPELPQPRSRIGTETSADSVEHVTCIDRSSFEDSEAFVGEDVLASGNAGGNVVNPNSGNLARQASVSTTSDSASDSGGSLTHHRFYHVFREGELDYLITRYVDNLHIISSYYDHANWCVVAEKVNVWTI